MTGVGSVGRGWRLLVATLGALVGVLSLFSGAVPGPLLESLRGTTLSAFVVFAALALGGFWVLRRASASAWRWAIAIGFVASAAQMLGLSLRLYDGLLFELSQPENVAWVLAHWFGSFWMVTAALAALITLLDSFSLPSASGSTAPADREGLLGLVMGALISAEPARRRKGLLLVMGALVLSKIPYLLVYWPGLVPFDTFRSLAYARGTSPWETYEPVGHSLRIAATDWLGTTAGLGDVGVIAIGSVTQIVALSAALTFMLARMASWGVPRALWGAAFAWATLHPVLGYFGVLVGKDLPFSVAVLAMIVSLGELVFGTSRATNQQRWPWVTLALAAIGVMLMRNNGIHVVVVTLLSLAFVLRSNWKPLVGVMAAVAVAFGAYVGPIYTLLSVEPGPKEEAYSVPIQQLGRIAKYESTELSSDSRGFMTRVFGQTPEELARHYVPQLTDPMKLSTRDAWNDGLSTSEFLVGWARVSLQHPWTALEATMANTMGYWDPVGSSYDGLVRWSSNDIRGILLDIPSGEPTKGIAAAIEESGIMPTRGYFEGMQDDGYRSIPLVGPLMSPGFVVWVWLVAGLLVLRTRRYRALAVFVPAGALLLSFLAGPVSGGQRYSLALYMALPLAIAAVALVARQSSATAGLVRPVQPSPTEGTLPMPVEQARETAGLR